MLGEQFQAQQVAVEPDRPFQHAERYYFEPSPDGFGVWDAFDGRVGMMICNDRRWPESYRLMGLQGVELILCGYNTPLHYAPDPTQDPLQGFHNQLVMSSGAYQNGTFVVGVAKGTTRKAGFETLIMAEGREERQLPADHPALHLIQQVRDEAHRFAVTYHRKLRSKRMVDSVLDSVPGIGPKRKRQLLRKFGSLKRLRNATFEEIAQVVPETIADELVAVLSGSAGGRAQ